MQPKIQTIGGPSLIHEIASRVKADRIVVALEERRGSFPSEELLKCRMEGMNIEDGVSFYERLTGKLLVEKTYPSALIFSNGFRKSAVDHAAKTGMDFLLSSIGLIMLAPIMVLVALAIKIDSPGPVFYEQERVGKNGTLFKLLKFRSMREDAEKETGPVWAEEKDDRITRMGRIIRKLRIDEVPQMINVLRGEMSLIGPRPERPHFVRELKKEIPLYEKRLVLKPGITGWAQVRYQYGASKNDALEKLQYDLYYMKNMSVFFDFAILFDTLRIVLFGSGAR